MMQVTFERYLQFFNEIFKTDHAHMRSHMSCSLTCIIRPLWFQRLVARLLVKMSQIRFDAAAASSFLLEASVPSLLGDLWSSSVLARQGRKRPRSRPRGAACPETGHVRTELTGRRGFRGLFSNLAMSLYLVASKMAFVGACCTTALSQAWASKHHHKLSRAVEAGQGLFSDLMHHS